MCRHFYLERRMTFDCLFIYVILNDYDYPFLWLPGHGFKVIDSFHLLGMLSRPFPQLQKWHMH